MSQLTYKVIIMARDPKYGLEVILEGNEEEKTPEDIVEDIRNDIRELAETNPEHKKVLGGLIIKSPRVFESNKGPSYWGEILEWCTKVRETLTADNVSKGLNYVGRKIYNNILKAVDYLVKLFKKERSMKEVQTLSAPMSPAQRNEEEEILLDVSQINKKKRPLEELNSMAEAAKLYDKFKDDRCQAKKQRRRVSDQTAEMVGIMITKAEQKAEEFDKKAVGKHSAAELSKGQPKKYKSYKDALIYGSKDRGGQSR